MFFLAGSFSSLLLLSLWELNGYTDKVKFFNGILLFPYYNLFSMFSCSQVCCNGTPTIIQNTCCIVTTTKIFNTNTMIITNISSTQTFSSSITTTTIRPNKTTAFFYSPTTTAVNKNSSGMWWVMKNPFIFGYYIFPYFN